MEKPPFSLIEGDKKFFYCTPCGEYISEINFYPSSIKTNRRCCASCLKKYSINRYKVFGVYEKKNKVANKFEQEDPQKMLEMFNNKCFLTNTEHDLTLVRYDQKKELSIDNCILISTKLVKKFKRCGLNDTKKKELQLLLKQ